MGSEPTSPLFVRLPTASAEKLSRAAFELKTPKRELVADLVDRYLGAEEVPLGRAASELRGPDVLTVEQLAELLQVDEKTVRSLAAKGELRGPAAQTVSAGPSWALLVVEEAVAGLAAEPALPLQLEQPFGRRHPLFAELVVERLGGVNVNVDPDEIDESARPQRPAGAVRHRLVEIFRCDACLVQDANAVVQQRDQDPVDDETRRVVAVDRLLARSLRPVVGGAHGVVRALERAHDLDQRQDRSRVEEVHADDALGPLGRLRDLGNRERGGVRREDRLRTGDPVELGEDLALERQLLQHGLDHEVAIRQVGELGRERQPADRRVLRLPREPPLFDATREIAVDRRLSPFAELVADFAPDRLEAGLHAHLRDAGPHRPEADDSYSPNLHGARSYFSAASRSE